MMKLFNILIIVFGVIIASLGEIEFSMAGFLYQMGGLVFEAIRLIMIQILLSDDKTPEKEPDHEEGFERVETDEVDEDIERAEKIGGVEGDEEANAKSISSSKPKGSGYKMDPLVSLYYYAPVCTVMNLFVALVVEIPTFDINSVFVTGPWILFANASIAFGLNVASVFLVCLTYIRPFNMLMVYRSAKPLLWFSPSLVFLRTSSLSSPPFSSGAQSLHHLNILATPLRWPV
jgi:hypothetical protein